MLNTSDFNTVHRDVILDLPSSTHSYFKGQKNKSYEWLNATQTIVCKPHTVATPEMPVVLRDTCNAKQF